jgi:hypothetical protein
MVNGALTVSGVKKLREQMKLIQGNQHQFEWFVFDVLEWYQKDLIKSNILHGNQHPPNLFRMKEHPGFTGIDVFAHFGKHRDSVEAYEDVVSVLNAYHLFYCYTDDAHPRTRYFNHFSGEVW